MQPVLKSSILFLLSIPFILFAQKSFAQYPGMQRVYNNRAMHNMQQQMNNMMMNLNYSGSDITNYKYDYEVVLKDSSKITVSSKIYSDTSLRKNYLLLVNKKYPKSDMAHREQKIYPGQTLSIGHVGHGFRGDSFYVSGKPNDSCWMFKVDSGAINIYSFLSEKGYDFSPYTIVAIQSGTGPIVHYDAYNIKAIISGDEEAMKYLEKKNYYKALMRYNKDAEKVGK